MTNAINFSYKVIDGPQADKLEEYLPSPQDPKISLLCPFQVVVYADDEQVGEYKVNCRFEAMAHYKDSIWMLFLRVKVADRTIAGSDEHRYLAVAYDVEERCGPARFGARSFLDFPIIIGAKKAGTFIA